MMSAIYFLKTFHETAEGVCLKLSFLSQSKLNCGLKSFKVVDIQRIFG